jgi:ABC-type multidrug transport system ATPase subunit
MASVPEATPAFSAEGVEKSYRSKSVLRGASLTVNRGESVALVGENGAGKSTFMNIWAGVLQPDAGTIRIDGSLGWCPQQPGLVDLLNAQEHLALLAAGTADPDASRRRALDMLDVLGFDHADTTVAKDLSGGQRQKLNLALTLLDDPQVLLLDEPYQGFDHGTYVNLWDQIASWTNEGRAVIVITHLLAERDRVSRVAEVGNGVVTEVD